MPSVNSYLTPNSGNVVLRDYNHASRLYLNQAYSLVPKNGWIYYAIFDINRSAIGDYRWAMSENIQHLGALVKSAELPKYQINTETLNQYNKKTVIQKNITYSPVSFTLHDDSSNTVHNMWVNYFKYYYADPNLGSDSGFDNTRYGGAYDSESQLNTNPVFYNSTDYGLNNPGVYTPFFNSITLYQMSRQIFTSYKLVNPKIKNWEHDKMDQTQGNRLAESRMTLEYEAVFYGSGRVRRDHPTGFAEFDYDNRPSPLTVGKQESFVDEIIDGAAEVFGDVTGLFNAVSSPDRSIRGNLLQDVLGIKTSDAGTNGYSINGGNQSGIGSHLLNGLGVHLNLNLGLNSSVNDQTIATPVSVVSNSYAPGSIDSYSSNVNAMGTSPAVTDISHAAYTFLAGLNKIINAPSPAVLPVTDNTPAGTVVAPGDYDQTTSVTLPSSNILAGNISSNAQLPPINSSADNGLIASGLAQSLSSTQLTATQKNTAAAAAAMDQIATGIVDPNSVNASLQSATSPEEFSAIQDAANSVTQQNISDQSAANSLYLNDSSVIDQPSSST
jgi:hypothetical protein